jgi:predicted Zn-dependent peptidase
MFFHSVHATKDIAVEKKVILEEIGMYEDAPEELVHDILSEAVWDGSAIGYPILGTRKSLRKLNRDTLLGYIKERYTPANTVISIAGNYEEAALVELLEKHFGGWRADRDAQINTETVEFKPGLCVKEKETEQVHICIGFNGVENGDDRIYPLLAVNNIFGGGMSSRLFQKIREKKGLVYSIYSYPTTYNDVGLFTIYAGMKPEQLNDVASLIYEEVRLLVKKGITAQELKKSKEQLKGNYILGMESTSSRMNSIGKSELMLGYINSPEEIMAKIEAINMDGVNEMIRRVFDLERKGISIVGNLKQGFDKKRLEG